MPPTTIWPGALRLASQRLAGGGGAGGLGPAPALAPSRASMPPGLASAAALGGLGPGDGEADAVVEADGAGGDQGGDLAERVAGEGHRRAELRSRAASQATSDEAAAPTAATSRGAGQVGVGVERAAGRAARPRGLLGLLDRSPGRVVDARRGRRPATGCPGRGTRPPRPRRSVAGRGRRCGGRGLGRSVEDCGGGGIRDWDRATAPRVSCYRPVTSATDR